MLKRRITDLFGIRHPRIYEPRVSPKVTGAERQNSRFTRLADEKAVELGGQVRSAKGRSRYPMIAPTPEKYPAVTRLLLAESGEACENCKVRARTQCWVNSRKSDPKRRDAKRLPRFPCAPLGCICSLFFGKCRVCFRPPKRTFQGSALSSTVASEGHFSPHRR
jgi:hypothetical protein